MMSNSNLVSYIDSGSQNRNNRTKPISKITVHHAAGVLSLEQFTSIMHSGRDVSWNYAIANDGSIGLYIPEAYRAWTSSSRSNDMEAITIEVSNSKNGDPWPISDAAYNSLLLLCEDICRRNNIKEVTYTGDRSGTLTMHKWFAATGCPGPTLGELFPTIASVVSQRLGSPNRIQYTTNPTSTEVSASGYYNTGSIIPIESVLDYTKISPYIAIPDRTVQHLDTEQLSKSGVIGVLLEAGHLYDDIHMKRNNYRNPYLEQLVKETQSGNIPYGITAVVSARTVDEANLELRELTLCLRKYKPEFGVWLKPEFPERSLNIASILDRYHEVLTNLGFRGQIGIIVTPQQLKLLPWDSMCDTWYLCISDTVDSMDELQCILTPEFFMTDLLLSEG